MAHSRTKIVAMASLTIAFVAPAAWAQYGGGYGSHGWGQNDDNHNRGNGGNNGNNDWRRGGPQNGPPTANSTLPIGTVVRDVPRRAREIKMHGQRYYVYEATCYQRERRGDRFVVVPPPEGLRMWFLPAGYERVRLQGRTYYCFDDVYYNDDLVVVACPIGGYIYKLPRGAEVIDRRDNIYRVGHDYYRAGFNNGRSVYVRISDAPNYVGPGPGWPGQGGGHGGGYGGKWQVLGSAKIRFLGNEETIRSGLLGGQFRQLQLEVTGGDAEIYGLTVQFMNGETFSPPLRYNFAEGSRSRTIDLPGGDRFIKEVRYRARSVLTRSGRATITISAR